MYFDFSRKLLMGGDSQLINRPGLFFRNSSTHRPECSPLKVITISCTLRRLFQQSLQFCLIIMFHMNHCLFCIQDTLITLNKLSKRQHSDFYLANLILIFPHKHKTTEVKKNELMFSKLGTIAGFIKYMRSDVCCEIKLIAYV